MEYNQPSEIVKDVNFGDNAKNKVTAGVEKLAKAVKSTLGASGKCVIYEDARGLPVITKDGVTVAESVVLFDPVENMGATLIKEAARNTVREAGDGTTTATVLAESLLKEVNSRSKDVTIREVKDGVKSGLKKVNDPENDKNWCDVTRRETIEGAEAAIDGSVDHFSKKLEGTKGPKVVKTFE